MVFGRWQIPGIWVIALLCAWAPLLSAQSSEPELTLDLSIARGSLLSAIKQFSEQSNIQVTVDFQSPELDARTIEPFSGSLTGRQALARILEGTNLSAEWHSSSTVRIYPGLVAPRAEDYATEVTVTGSRIGGGEGPAPVRVYGRDDIDRYGVSSLPGLAGYFTQQPFSFGEFSQRSGAQHFQMRGLGVDTTLVLINGRRAPPSATSATLNAFDLNTIPLTAVDRIEVMSDSASAIYGSDAIGGVVNIILKKDIASPDLYFHYGAADGGGEERRVAGSIGTSGARLKSSLVVDYFGRDMLVGAERDMWRNQDFTRFGGTDYRVTTANPGNVYSLSGGPLPGLPTSQASVPAGSDGILRPEDFLSTAGVANLYSSSRTWSILPDLERLSAFGSAEFSINKRTILFGELLAAQGTVVGQSDFPSLLRQVVPAENPYNPFGEPVMVDHALAGMKPIEQVTDSQLTRFVLGARGGLSRWEWELALNSSTEHVDMARKNDVDSARVQAALASTDPNTALNPFMDGPAGSAALLSSLVGVPQVVDLASGGSQLSGFLRGPLFQMPGGKSEFVIGSEWRREELKFFDQTSLERERDVASGFAEVRLPLLNQLSLKLALRGDYYESAEDSVNPQYGLVWRPTRDWLVRAAYGTSFRPPSLTELYSPRSDFVFPLADPRRGGSVSMIRFSVGGNPDLENVSAHSFTSGIVYTPSDWPGLHLAAHYWRVVMDNRIVSPRFSDLANMEAVMPDRVTRAAPTEEDRLAGWPGALESIDTSLLNYGRLMTSGIDFDLKYQIDVTVGRLQTALSATWVEGYSSQDISSIVARERVGIANLQGTIPEWRLVGSLVWEAHGWGASATTTFTPRYWDADFAGMPHRRLPSRTLIDMQAWLELGEVFGPSLFDGVKLTAGVVNLLNREVDFADAGFTVGYDVSQANLRQRFGYLRLTKSF